MRFLSPLHPISSSAAILSGFVMLATGCEALRGGASGPRGDFITTVYLNEEEALGVVFPDAARVVRDSLVLSSEELGEAKRLLGHPLRQRRFDAYVAFDERGRLDGYAVIQNEIGKFKPFTFIVGVEPDGSVRRVAVLVYREARGGEISHRRFLVQYRGKTVGDSINKNYDIINVQGATMSVDSLNYGVKKVLAVLEAAYRERPARVAKLLSAPAVAADGVRTETTAVGDAALWNEVRESRYLMGTLCEIRAFGKDPAKLRQALAEGFDEIEVVERALSDYRDDSELSRLSLEGHGQEVAVSPLVVDFLRAGTDVSRRTGGAFDLTVGPVVDAWGFRAKSYRVPGTKELAALRECVGYEKVALRRRHDGTWMARLARGGMRLDPGGLGKGFALDRCVRRLKALGVEAALVDFSSTVYALGAPPEREAWTVAVREPGRGKTILGHVKLRDAALSVSGSAEKFFELDGERYSHILSPFTAAPLRKACGAIVVAGSGTVADGYATAACVLGKEAPGLFEREEGVEGAVVVADEPGQPVFLTSRRWSRVFTEADGVGAPREVAIATP